MSAFVGTHEKNVESSRLEDEKKLEKLFLHPPRNFIEMAKKIVPLCF